MRSTNKSFPILSFPPTAPSLDYLPYFSYNFRVFASLLFFLLLYPSLGVDVVGAGTGAGALNSALFPPAPPPPNYFRIFDHLASLFSDSHFLLSNPLLPAPFPPLPSRIFAIFTICSLASSSCNFRIFACFVVISLHVL
ncbi:uncharacterized protein EDB91DRAFT_1349083 [Suillus paluster]|uniref:uncharacterized protein n=1 Tax=Suillus paluster TaxID=48578 RepID=UPI001B8692AF|nr:uncharacterized protein EDB91DRAFT_1349083 [Suillus paluster]KAG1732432.1 hypothetical protein EDB91DRAFT_1349083 [Suillus paluster]